MIACPTRRFTFAFALLALAAAACAPDAPDPETITAELPLVPEVRLRLMAANLTSGTSQSYDAGHGIRIFQGVEPDIVMIQEFKYGGSTTSEIRSFVDTAFGTTFSYYREGGSGIPNGIISRYPIIQSGEWNDSSVADRDFAYARIDIPGPTDLWAVSVHLLTSSSGSRSTEAQQLVNYIQQQVPAGDYLVIGGDLNTASRGESCVTKLAQVVVTGSPYPADKNGNTNTNRDRSKPYDWLLVDADLGAYKTAVVLGASSFTNGLVADTRVYSPIAELSPALAGDSNATNMQHSGVVRDFLIPGDPDTGSSSSGSGGSGGSSGGGGSGGSGPGAPVLLLNEILANEPGSDVAAEFVEIVNIGGGAADLGGYTLADSAATRHTFAAGTTLGAGQAVVVFGGASAIPPGLSGAVAASTGALGLGNSGDTVTLKDGGGASVDSVTYASTLSSTDGVSMNRSPDAGEGASFALHTTLSSSSSSPGTRVDGGAF